MKKILFLFLGICQITGIYAQEINPYVLGNGGLNGSTLQTQIQFTLGQTAIGNSDSTSCIVNEGFQQHYFGSTGFQNTCTREDSIPVYQIGEIAQQTAFSSIPLVFYICTDSLEGSVMVSMEIKDVMPNGQIEFSPVLGKFSFTPSGLDQGIITVIFQASNGIDSIWQEVGIEVNPLLQSEQTAFGLESSRPLPPAESDDFVIITQADLGTKNFNHQNRKTFSFSIAGKTLVFDENVENKLQTFTRNVRSDITELNIYAESIIIGSELEFPQTNITIHTRHLIFKDKPGKISSINTRPKNPAPDPIQRNPKKGLNAGSITLYIQNLDADPGNRFRLIGGKGQSTREGRGAQGGKGGIFTSNLDLECFADYVGGQSGSGPSKGNKGSSGAFRFSAKDHFWLHPFALKMVIAHAKEAYLNNYLDFPQQVFEDYIQQIDLYKASPDWVDLSIESQQELDQLQQEAGSLLYRISSNLDYFGNPAGWVPMLSFEVNKLAFEQEIDRSTQILYLTYWVQRVNASIGKKREALNKAKEQQLRSIVEFQQSYDEAVLLLPQLEAEAASIVGEMEKVQTELGNLEEKLTEKAKFVVEERHKPPKRSLWRTITRTVGTIAQAVPVYQPALGTIGGGLVSVSEINFNDPLSIIQNGTNAVKSFNNANFKQSAENFDDQLKALDFTQLGTDPNKWKDYYEMLKPKAASIYSAISDLRKQVGKTKVPLAEIQAELTKMKAESPEFNELIDQVNRLMIQKAQFEQNISVTLQSISSMANDIQNSILAIDGINEEIFNNDSRNDLRAMLYVKDMERRAKERIIKYHYYMGKAYEYRLLEAYNTELNLPGLFDRFVSVVEDEIAVDQNGFQKLKALYDDVLQEVTNDILTIYNQNAPEISAPLRFNFTDADLALLNAGQPVNLNMVERGMFQPFEENIRILGFKIIDIEMHFEGGSPGSFAFFDILMEHSGISKLKKDGEVYFFNHYNNETVNPISWGIRFDASDGLVQPKEPSPYTESLLRSLLEGLNKFNNENIILYSRPAAWADIVVSKNDRTSNGVKMVVDKLRCELTYDFQQLQNGLVSLNVSTNDDANLRPYIQLNREDNNNRQDGWGSFNRSYFKNASSTVRVEAPRQYGIWEFDSWTDAFGNFLEDSVAMEVDLGTDHFIKANYQKILPELLVEADTIFLPKSAGSEKIGIRNIGNGNLDWQIIGSNNWLSLNADSIGTNDGTPTFSYTTNETGRSRETKLAVVAPASIEYLDTVVIIQEYITTSLTNLETKSQVTIYPNPVENLLFVKLDRVFPDAQIIIYDNLGKMVKSLDCATNELSIDVLGFPSGLYFLEFRTKEKRTFKKFIIR